MEIFPLLRNYYSIIFKLNVEGFVWTFVWFLSIATNISKNWFNHKMKHICLGTSLLLHPGIISSTDIDIKPFYAHWNNDTHFISIWNIFVFFWCSYIVWRQNIAICSIEQSPDRMIFSMAILNESFLFFKQRLKVCFYNCCVRVCLFSSITSNLYAIIWYIVKFCGTWLITFSLPLSPSFDSIPLRFCMYLYVCDEVNSIKLEFIEFYIFPICLIEWRRDGQRKTASVGENILMCFYFVWPRDTHTHM